MDFLLHGIEAVANAIMPADKTQHDVDFDLAAAEAGERSARLDILQMAHDQSHAHAEAELINEACYNGPCLAPLVVASRRRTRLMEEAERARRIASKSEIVLRKRNAHKAALIISSLGWPFVNYNKGLYLLYVEPTRLACEIERDLRVHDTVGAFIARCNAGLISNLIRWANHADDGALVRNATHALEENERARRLADREAMSLASHNAYIVSRMIKELGWPFYVQEIILEKESALVVLKHVGENVLDVAVPALNTVADKAAGLGYVTLGAAATALPVAKRTAQNVAGTLLKGASALGLVTLGAAVSAVEATKEALPAAKVNAKIAINAAGNATVNAINAISSWTEQAQEHVVVVSKMVPPHALTTAQLEEKERRYRMRHATQGRVHASHEAALIKGLQASRPLVQYLYEAERARRLADVVGQDIAFENAYKIACLIRSHNLPQTIAKESFLFETAPHIIMHVPAPLVHHTAVLPGHHAYRARKTFIALDEPAPTVQFDLVQFAHHDLVRTKAPLVHAHNAPVPPMPKTTVPQASHDAVEKSLPHPHSSRAAQQAPVPAPAVLIEEEIIVEIPIVETMPATAALLTEVVPIASLPVTSDVAEIPVDIEAAIPIVETIPVASAPLVETVMVPVVEVIAVETPVIAEVIETAPIVTPVAISTSPILAGLPQARYAYDEVQQPVAIVETTTVETTTVIPPVAVAAPIPIAAPAPIPVVAPIPVAPIAQQLPATDYSQFYDFSTPFSQNVAAVSAPVAASTYSQPVMVQAPRHIPVTSQAPSAVVAQPASYPAVTTRTYVEPAQAQGQQGHMSVKDRLRSLAHRHRAGNPSM